MTSFDFHEHFRYTVVSGNPQPCTRCGHKADVFVEIMAPVPREVCAQCLKDMADEMEGFGA